MAEREAGVSHHVALSIVGIERSPENGYFRAKLAQESLIKCGEVPYTIVRSTQFLEFLAGIADAATVNQIARTPAGAFQPIAADDVADFIAEAAVSAPINGSFDIAGPEKAPMSEFIARYLTLINDDREVVADAKAQYFGSAVDDRSLVPTGAAKLGNIGLDKWFKMRSGAPE